jgi:hypothetical protein
MRCLRVLLPGGAVVAVLILALFELRGAVAEPTIERYVEFRDGSVLRLGVVNEELKVSVLRANGQVEERTVRWADVRRLQLTAERIFPRKRVILALVQKLGADEFAAREQAQADLIRMGATIRPDLERAQELFADFEIKDRLKKIVARWPAAAKPAESEAMFDSLELKETLWGDAGEDGIPVAVDGKVRRLSRRDVASLREQPSELDLLDTQRSVPGGFRRIQEGDFPHGCIEESFETAPDGRRLQVGENIEKLFIRKGFTLSTSIKTSFVSVNNYTVQGKSRGLSAATHQPLFEGEITIRFCRPGRETVPAGVTHFGCWIAAVVPKGTYLVAYDLRGKELGRINTEGGPNEFLGIRSSVPMHTIKVVPDVNIDRDYTLDDFIFTPPIDAELAHPEKYRAQFTDGERVLCSDIRFGPKGVEVFGLPAGLPDRTRPLTDLHRVSVPSKGRPDQPPAGGVYVALRDGSVLFGAKPKDTAGAPIFARRPDLLQQPERINELWSSSTVRMGLPPKVEPPVVWTDPKKAWQGVIDVRLTRENVSWQTTVGGERLTFPYFNPTQLVLRRSPAEATPGSWHIRTVQGDDIVLSLRDPPQLSGRMSQEVATVWEQTPLKITGADLSAVYRVPPAP